MINMQVRKIFKDMPEFGGAYKINYLGDLYSVRLKKLKKLEPTTNKYLLKKAGNLYKYARKDVQKIFFSIDDESTIYLDNVYKDDICEDIYITSSKPSSKYLDSITQEDIEKNFKYKYPASVFKSEEQIIDIYKRSNNGYTIEQLAKEYNIDNRNIFNIKVGVSYREITSKIKFPDTTKQYEDKRCIYVNGSILDQESIYIIHNICNDLELNVKEEYISYLFDIDVELVSKIKKYNL